MEKEFVYTLGKESDEAGFSGEITVKVKGGVFRPKVDDYSFRIKNGDDNHSRAISFKNSYFSVSVEDSWLMDEDAMVHKLGEKIGLARKEGGVYVTRVPHGAEMELNDNGSLKKLSVRLKDEWKTFSVEFASCTAEETVTGKWKVTDNENSIVDTLLGSRNCVIKTLEKTPTGSIIDKYFARALDDYKNG